MEVASPEFDKVRKVCLDEEAHSGALTRLSTKGEIGLLGDYASPRRGSVIEFCKSGCGVLLIPPEGEEFDAHSAHEAALNGVAEKYWFEERVFGKSTCLHGLATSYSPYMGLVRATHIERGGTDFPLGITAPGIESHIFPT